MEICEWCGRSFDLEEAEDFFDIETFALNYNNLKKKLCGNCAVQAIEDKVDGVYFETCEKCGKEFDLFVDEIEFANNFEWFSGTELRDYWKNHILCAECALEEAEKENSNV